MIHEVCTDAEGQRYEVLVPENAADLRALARDAARGEVDARSSHGDDPEVWGVDPEDADLL